MTAQNAPAASAYHSTNRVILALAGFIAVHNGPLAGLALGYCCLLLHCRETGEKLCLNDVTRHVSSIALGYLVGLLIRDWDDVKAGLIQGLIDGGL